MANVRSSNSYYVDSASTAGTTTSFVAVKSIFLSAIVFTPSAANDSITLADLDPISGNSAGNVKFTISASTAKDTKFINLYECNVVFPNGIWVSAISTGATATLIASSAGS